jgi:adenylosuccinate lyase
MARNLADSRGMIYSQTLLLALVRSGLTREEAYALVQENAMKVWSKEHPDLLAACLADPRMVQRLGVPGIRSAFDMKRLLKHLPAVVKRALKA